MGKLQKIKATTGETYFIDPARITFMEPQKDGSYLMHLDVKWSSGQSILLTISRDEAEKFAEIGDYVVGPLKLNIPKRD